MLLNKWWKLTYTLITAINDSILRVLQVPID